MRNDFYVGMYEDRYLSHGLKGWVKKGHKYIARKWKNGRWYYIYQEMKNAALSKAYQETANITGNYANQVYDLIEKNVPVDSPYRKGLPLIKRRLENNNAYRDAYLRKAEYYGRKSGEAHMKAAQKTNGITKNHKKRRLRRLGKLTDKWKKSISDVDFQKVVNDYYKKKR